MKYSDVQSVILILLILFLINCSKGEDAIAPIQNKPPQAFSLLSPNINEDNISRKPTFSWEEAIDEEGDKVTYDLYLGKQVEGTPMSLLAQDLSATSYTSKTILDFDKEYQWKVVAKDATGASTSSPVSSFRIQQPPILFLRRHAIGTTDKYFEYSDDGYLIELQDSNQDSWNLKYNTSTEKIGTNLYGYANRLCL